MCDTGVAPKRLLVGKRAAIRPSQATNSRPHRRAPIPTTMGIARARWDPRLPSTFAVACPRPWDGIGCTPLMSFPRKLPTCGQHRCAAMYRPVSCDFLSGEEFSRAWTRLLDSGVQQSEWGFLSSPQAVSVQVSTFQASSEALRRNSTTILLRLFNPAMRLKCGSKLTRICSTLAALGGVSCRVQAIIPRHCVYGGRPASNSGPYGAHLGIENPCQAFSIIGSDIGRWPCWVCRSRSRMRQETTGLPEISPRKTFGVHVERGVDVERGVSRGYAESPASTLFVVHGENR